jgi:hypothetical protein
MRFGGKIVKNKDRKMNKGSSLAFRRSAEEVGLGSGSVMARGNADPSVDWFI